MKTETVVNAHRLTMKVLDHLYNNKGFAQWWDSLNREEYGAIEESVEAEIVKTLAESRPTNG